MPYVAYIYWHCILTITTGLSIFFFNDLQTAAACSLGLNVGDDCKVEDKDAGYVFDLTPLATHKWEKKDFYTIKSTSQYEFQLKVRA